MLDEAEVLVRLWGSDYLKYYPQLITFVVKLSVFFHAHVFESEVWAQQMARLPWEERLSLRKVAEVLPHHRQQLSKDASNTPNINFVSISILSQNNLRCSVPPSDHMLRKLFRF